MAKSCINLTEGAHILLTHIQSPDNLPISFVYDDVKYHGFKDLRAAQSVINTNKGVKTIVKANVDKLLRASLECIYNEAFAAIEYEITFENIGNEPTKVLRDIFAFDDTFDGEKPVLCGCDIDHDGYIYPYEQDLEKADKYLSSHESCTLKFSFPYFNLALGQGGILMALGWSGTWEALFSYDLSTTHIKAKTNVGFNAVLLPGEKISTGSILIIPYKGRNLDASTNLWREFYMKNILPKFDVSGKTINSFSTISFIEDLGVNRVDRSSSEKNTTWQPSLEKVLQEEIKPDIRLYDAGWYVSPSNESSGKDWHDTIGIWKADSEKWPGKTLREANDIYHSVGIKNALWFESSRITHINELVENYGYNYSWCVGDGVSRFNNIGDPDCFAWTLKQICGAIDEYGVDLYREDSDIDCINYWNILDEYENKSLGVPRCGIAENKYVVAHYALWDSIIEYCEKHNKCTFIDEYYTNGCCFDYESMKRAIPFLRSFNDEDNPELRLAQTAIVGRWLPFHGNYTKEKNKPGIKYKGLTQYSARASYLPIWNLSEAYSSNLELDYGLMRRNFNEWRLIRHLLYKDMYLLTPWHHEKSMECWNALAYDDPEKGETVLLIFRPENSRSTTGTIKMPFMLDASVYSVRDIDTGKALQKSGRDLNYGIKFFLPEAKSSAVLYIKKMC